MGASLLAMATGHSTLMSTDPPLSRAGSLPQGGQLGWWAVRRLVNREVRHPAHSKVPRAQPTAKHTDKHKKKRRHAHVGACTPDIARVTKPGR
ncbi:hypothetical protein EI534_29575 [Pseudomonas frederiksbergensis]|nr:hypothetical protein [Pseudomonas frederiksbergensis]